MAAYRIVHSDASDHAALVEKLRATSTVQDATGPSWQERVSEDGRELLVVVRYPPLQLAAIMGSWAPLGAEITEVHVFSAAAVNAAEGTAGAYERDE